MHMCSSRGRGGGIRSGCGATGAQGQAPQQEVREESAQGPANPSAEQQTQGKPWCTSYYLKLCHLYMYLLLVLYVSGVDWNPSYMIPSFP